MRLKHIYITKEGEPMGNPEMDFPKFKTFESQEEGEEQEMVFEQWQCGLIPFEDIQAVWYHPSVYQFMNIEQLEPKDTLIPVDIEAEVVVDAETGALLLRIKN